MAKLPIARPSEPSFLKSAQSMPIAPRAAPDWSKAIPEVIPISSNSAAAQVVEEEVGDRVVGDDQVDQAVAVDVDGATPSDLATGALLVGRADVDARPPR